MALCRFSDFRAANPGMPAPAYKIEHMDGAGLVDLGRRCRPNRSASSLVVEAVSQLCTMMAPSGSAGQSEKELNHSHLIMLPPSGTGHMRQRRIGDPGWS